MHRPRVVYVRRRQRAKYSLVASQTCVLGQVAQRLGQRHPHRVRDVESPHLIGALALRGLLLSGAVVPHRLRLARLAGAHRGEEMDGVVGASRGAKSWRHPMRVAGKANPGFHSFRQVMVSLFRSAYLRGSLPLVPIF